MTYRFLRTLPLLLLAAPASVVIVRLLARLARRPE